MKSAPRICLKPRHQFPKHGSTHHHDGPNRQIHHRRAVPRGAGDAQTDFLPGQVVLRLLCHVTAAGGVIGNSGSIIKQLETRTGAKIRFEEPLPNCPERVVNVIGDSAVDRKISLNLEAIEGGSEEDIFEVSRVQEGIMRVFNRIVEVARNDNGVVGCRLLGVPGQIGALMGKGGKIVDAIGRNSGAKIRVLNEDQVPSSAAPDEEVIQIMGDVRAVKTALVSVSRHLQDCMQGERLQTFSEWTIQDTHLDFLPKENILRPYFPGNFADHTSAGTTLSADVDRILSLHEGSTERRVVFRLLCSNGNAGGVIGTGATIVKLLEKETGASIKFSGPVAGSNERVATISSYEIADPLPSSAQIATFRVFAKSVEVSIDRGLIPSVYEGETVTARILVAPNEIGCLMDDNGKVASDISSTCGVEISLLCAPSCAAEDDKVVQITGGYENVKRTIYQVTGRLRDKLFSSTMAGESKSKFYPYSSIDQLNHPGFNHKHKDMQEDSLRRSMASGVGVHQNRTIEVLVPGNVFSNVYGENGSNLARMKEISGPAVMLHDPSPRQCDGKVIISGPPDHILVAQSLLQAFLLT